MKEILSKLSEIKIGLLYILIYICMFLTSMKLAGLLCKILDIPPNYSCIVWGIGIKNELALIISILFFGIWLYCIQKIFAH